VAQPGADQVLVRRHAEHTGEQPQEMKRAQADAACGVREIDRPMRMRVDPQRGLDRASPIARIRRQWPALLAGDHREEARGEQHAGLVEADIAGAGRCGLRQFAQHHQLGQRRQGAGAPGACAVADGLGQRGRQLDMQALVAASVVVRAHVLVAWIADHDRAGDQVKRLAARAIADAALAHIADVEAAVQLDERLVAGADAAAIVHHRDGLVAEQGGDSHGLS
jgi:hypothetical protein